MAVFLVFPKLHTAPHLRRADGIVGAVVAAADAAAAPAAMRALIKGATAKDFVGWSTMKVSDAEDAGFKPCILYGDSIIGPPGNNVGLPTISRGGNVAAR